MIERAKEVFDVKPERDTWGISSHPIESLLGEIDIRFPKLAECNYFLLEPFEC